MTRISWQLIDVFSATLDPREREAVLGDFAESGESGSKALCEVLGLVIRRQAAVWTAWRPWLTLTVLIVPLGIFLSVLSRSTADESAVYAWMYANNWDWALVTNRGFWYVLSESATLVFAGWLVLVCWSWTTGFVLGYFSKGIVRVNRVLLLLALALGEAVSAPAYIAYYFNYLYRHFHVASTLNPNAPVFALTFYRAIFPIIIQVILVAGPAIYGIRAGVQMTGLRRPSRALFLSLAILTIATMIIQVPGLAFFLNANTQGWMLKFPEIIRAARFISYSPALYVLAMVIRQHRNTRVIATQLL